MTHEARKSVSPHHRRCDRRCGLLLALAVSGCCWSSQVVDAKRQEVFERNRRRADPAMRTAAEARGATLLEVEPASIAMAPPCTGDTDKPQASGGDYCHRLPRDSQSCIAWGSSGRFFELRRRGQPPKLGVLLNLVGFEERGYARLAKRGNTLIILRPVLSPGEVEQGVQCECDGMPRPDCMDSFGFLVDAIASPVIEEITVPMTEDRLEIECKLTGV